MIRFCWHEHAAVGGQPVSPYFETPEEAGQWRRDNPPLVAGQGPTLRKYEGPVRVGLEPGELAAAFTQFADREEPRLDLSAEATLIP